MNIGIDFDGTITSTNQLKTLWIQKNIGITIPACHCNRSDCEVVIGTEMYNAMSKVVYNDENTERLLPLPEAIQVIAKLKSIHSLYIVTARKDRGISSARRWLDTYSEFADIQLLSMSEGNKLEICQKYEINILIDDDIRHLLDMKKTDIIPVLFRENCNVNNDSLLTVTDWNQIGALIDQLSK